MASNDFYSKNAGQLRTNIEQAKKVKSGKVLALHNLKMPPDEIAKQLGLDQDEVQQIILSYLKLK